MSFIDKVKDLIADNADKVLEAAIAKAGRYFEKAGDTGGTRKSPHRVRSQNSLPPLGILKDMGYRAGKNGLSPAC